MSRYGDYTETYVDNEGRHRWRTWSRNGNITGDSGEGYDERRGMLRGLRAALNGLSAIARAMRWTIQGYEHRGALIARLKEHGERYSDLIAELEAAAQKEYALRKRSNGVKA